MEVNLSPDKEARLLEFAGLTGKDAAQVVEEAVDRMLEYDERFIAAVEEGRASARRGDLLEHEEVVKRDSPHYRTFGTSTMMPMPSSSVHTARSYEMRAF